MKNTAATAETPRFDLSHDDILKMIYVDSGATALVSMGIAEAYNDGEIGETFTISEGLQGTASLVSASRPTFVRALKMSPCVTLLSDADSPLTGAGRPPQVFKVEPTAYKERLEAWVEKSIAYENASLGIQQFLQRYRNTGIKAHNDVPDMSFISIIQERNGGAPVTNTVFRRAWLREQVEQFDLHYASNAVIQQFTGIRKDSVRALLSGAMYASMPRYGYESAPTMESAARAAKKGLVMRGGEITPYIIGGGMMVGLPGETRDWKWIQPNTKIDVSPDGWVARSEEDVKKVVMENQRLQLEAGAAAEGCTVAEYQQRREKRQAKLSSAVRSLTTSKKRQSRLPKIKFAYPDWVANDAEFMLEYDIVERSAEMYMHPLTCGYTINKDDRHIYTPSGEQAVEGEYTYDKIMALPDLNLASSLGYKDPKKWQRAVRYAVLGGTSEAPAPEVDEYAAWQAAVDNIPF